jgi:hypothetical protein
MLGTAWGLRERPTAVPGPLRTVVALTAIPCMAVAGVLMAQGLAGPQFRWAGGVAGANVAALMALALMPEVVLFALEVQFVAAAILVALIMGLQADAIQAAAVTAAVSAGLLAAARRTSAIVTAWGQGLPRGGFSAAEATTDLVVRSGRMLAVVMAGPVAALCITLPLLAMSGRIFAVVLTGVVSIALAVRSRQAAFTNELLMYGGAAVVGFFSLLVEVGRMMNAASGMVAALLLVAGIVVVGVGVAMSVLMPATQEEEPSTRAAGPRPPMRRTRAEVLGVLTGISIAPVTMGVFGVFGHLIMVGRSMF